MMKLDAVIVIPFLCQVFYQFIMVFHRHSGYLVRTLLV